VRVVQAEEGVLERLLVPAERPRRLGDVRWSAVRDDRKVDVPPDVEVERVHDPDGGRLRRFPLPASGGPPMDSPRDRRILGV